MRAPPAIAAAILAAACAGPARELTASSGGEREAARLYRSKCASCHRIHDPSEFTREGWKKNLDQMQGRAHLTRAEREEIERYLAAHARDAQPAS